MGELVALACSLHEPCSTRWDGDSEVGGRPAPRAPAQHEPVTPLLVLPKIRRILDVVAQNRAGAALREIRRRAELPPSTCLRLLQNLVAEGFLDRRGDRYFAGPLLLRWGGRARGGPGCTDRVHQVLERLRDDTGETAALFVRDGWRRIVAGLAPGRHPEEEPFELGQALPLHAGSAGWVFRTGWVECGRTCTGRLHRVRTVGGGAGRGSRPWLGAGTRGMGRLGRRALHAGVRSDRPARRGDRDRGIGLSVPGGPAWILGCRPGRGGAAALRFGRVGPGTRRALTGSGRVSRARPLLLVWLRPAIGTPLPRLWKALSSLGTRTSVTAGPGTFPCPGRPAQRIGERCAPCPRPSSLPARWPRRTNPCSSGRHVT